VRRKRANARQKGRKKKTKGREERSREMLKKLETKKV
jgi:hypothetical protein